MKSKNEEQRHEEQKKISWKWGIKDMSYDQFPLEENVMWKSKWSNFKGWNWRHLKGDINFNQWYCFVKIFLKINFNETTAARR